MPMDTPSALPSRLQRRSTPPLPCGEDTLAFETLVFQLRWPNGGFVWNYPLAVQATRNGTTQRHPIVDVTRLAQLTLWALALLAGVFALAASRRPKGENKHE